MEVRELQGLSFLESLKLSCICFNYPFSTDGKEEMDYVEYLRASEENKALNAVSLTLGTYNDSGELMSCLCLLPFEFYFDGNIVTGGGIGNVCTYPQHRRKGAVRELFVESLSRMYAEGMTFSYLYPFSEKFYNTFGYSPSDNSIRYQWNLLSLPNYKPEGSFHLFGLDAEFSDFWNAYEIYASQLNMMVKRDSMDWRNLQEAKGNINNNYAYLYKDSNGKPRGYIILKGEEREGIPYLACRELVFDDSETLKAILAFAKTYAWDYRYIQFYAPSYMKLNRYCVDYSMGHNSITYAKNGMVRVVNVEKALKSARYKGSGSLTIQIKDPFLIENQGIFDLEFLDGRATLVRKVNTSDSIDIIMGIDLFSCSILGNYDVWDFRWMEGIQINCSVEKIGKVFYQKPCFINNYF